MSTYGNAGAALVSSVLVSAAGAFLGATQAAAEPDGEFVSCGRVLFRDRNVPDPAGCADSYAPFDTIAVVLLGTGTVLLVLAGVLLWQAVRNSRSDRISA